MTIVRNPGSFRDPSGYVAHEGGRILRVLREDGFGAFERLKSSGLLAELVAQKRLVPTDVALQPSLADLASHVLEHEPINFISYPYEWPFELLKRAALFHLDLHLSVLESGFTLTDASAYNVQFVGNKPIFIDPLSLVPYSEGQLWFGQRQFHEQFLNPLLLTSLSKIPFNAWYRGAIEGVSSQDLASVLRTRHKLSWRVWSEVLLPVWLQKSARKNPAKVAVAAQRKLPLSGFRFMLRNLRSWIAGLRDPFGTESTTWRNYVAENSYLPEDEKRKQAFVSDFTRRFRPRTVWDLGCNTGLYSETALRAGAQYVVGFDSDHGALNLAVQRSLQADLKFLPLHMDACNPSPSQGWHQKERAGLSSRSKPNAILALALEHHIAIGRNVPLPLLLDWMIGLADSGVLEFVPKTDPVIQRMLSTRQDIFDQYSQAEFESELTKRAAVERREVVSSSGRTLYAYVKSAAHA
jgi:ribosomal protein L11 methylase PrmA